MTTPSHFTWAVIGAGASGIAAVGKLLDAGVNPKKIAWIDPYFNVGDLGRYWYNVPSNTKVKFFTAFLNNCSSFNYVCCPHAKSIQALNQEATCTLGDVVKPLRWITHCLKQRLHSIQDEVTEIRQYQEQWQLILKNTSIISDKIILATGSVPKILTIPTLQTISLETALNPEQLATELTAKDHIAVFGASHSAVLVIKNLLEHPVHVINFFRSPLRYAVALPDKILFDNTGLKGEAADWAKKYMDAEWHPRLTRICATPASLAEYIPQCNKAVYAIGFNARKLHINDAVEYNHDPKTGAIANGLYGLGVAFPETITNFINEPEANVGLWKFMKYLNRVMPNWLETTSA